MEEMHPYGEIIWRWYPQPYTAVSFDLGNKAFGVAWLQWDPYQLLELPSPAAVMRLASGESLEERLSIMEDLVALYTRAVNRALSLWVDVWDLMPGVAWADVDMDLTARNLKPRLGELDRRFGPHSEVHYEFQMNRNDKSRTVSSFVRYHYAGVCPVRKVPGTLKNTVTLRPELDHRLYLARHEDQYRANKEHAADSFRYLAQVWGVDIQHVPRAVHKDAGDAVMQLWARLLERIWGRVPSAKAKAKAKTKAKSRRPRMRDEYEFW